MRARAQIKSHPIHPMLVAFPIGLWVASFVFDLLGKWRNDASFWATGFYLVIAGCIGAALAALPGVVDLFSIIPPNSSAKSRGYLHGGLNVAALVLFIVIAARRGNATVVPDQLSLILSALGVIGLGISGWLGGTLVYRNQIAVDHRYANAGSYKERTLRGWDQPVCNQGELSDGQMMLAKVGDLRVVVGRCNEGMFAFSDHCTHKGGPLSDGALVGCTVQCPWHGSQFDVRSGRVVAGPASTKIETYKAEVRNGEVYVSPNRTVTSEQKPAQK